MQAALVEALDLVLARRASGPLPGERRAAGRGAGTELAQIRPYQFGDDVRRSTPRPRARTGHPPCPRPRPRAHADDVAARRRLGVDGVRDGRPAEVRHRRRRRARDRPARRAARGARRRCSRAARRSRSSCRRAAGGPALVALRKALAKGVARDGHAPEDALAAGHAPRQPPRPRPQPRRGGERLPRGDATGQRALRRARRRAMTCSPSRSSIRARRELPDAGHLTLVDPETGQRFEADTSSAELRRRFAAAELGAPRRAEVAPAPGPRAARRAGHGQRLAAGPRKEPAMSFQAPLFLARPGRRSRSRCWRSARAPQAVAVRRPLPGDGHARRGRADAPAALRKHLPPALLCSRSPA